MATVTGLTASRMLEIEAESVVDGHVDGSGHLILTKHDASTIDAGSVIGPTGPTGPPDVNSVKITGAQSIAGIKTFTDLVIVDFPTGGSPIPALEIATGSDPQIQLWDDGGIVANGSSHRFGRDATGTGGQKVHLWEDGVNCFIGAESSSAPDVAMIARSKGHGVIALQRDDGTSLFQAHSNGHLEGSQGTGTPTLSNLDGNFATSSIVGTDTCGVITLHSTSSPSLISQNTRLVTLSFADLYGATPRAVMLQANGTPVNPLLLVGFWNTTSIDIAVAWNWPPIADTDYHLTYFVIE